MDSLIGTQWTMQDVELDELGRLVGLRLGTPLSQWNLADDDPADLRRRLKVCDRACNDAANRAHDLEQQLRDMTERAEKAGMPTLDTAIEQRDLAIEQREKFRKQLVEMTYQRDVWERTAGAHQARANTLEARLSAVESRLAKVRQAVDDRVAL